MPSASLNKMTVPLASDASQGSTGILMPKLKYRFRVMFENFGIQGAPVTEMTKQVIDFTRPTVTFENIDIPIYNSTLKMAGKHSWGDVTCNLRDDAGANVQQLVGSQLQKQLDFFEMASAAAGASSAAGFTTDTNTGFFLPCVTAFTPLGNVMSPRLKEIPFFRPDKSTLMASGKSAGKQVISSSFMM